MLKLFESIFGPGEAPGRFPDSLVEMAIERSVDATNPLMRALRGYRKHLRAPVIHALEHVNSLVDSIPAPLSAEYGNYGADARLAALFASAEHMIEVFADDFSLREFLRSSPAGSESVIALLLAERSEKHVLGMEMVGEVLRRDVAQVAINFHNHRLADPSATEEQTRRQLKRRAFDHLLTLSLRRIVEVMGERADLARQRALLRRKLKTLQRGGWGFEYDPEGPQDPSSVSKALDRIEQRLTELGGDTKVLQTHMGVLVGVLSQAERQLWSDSTVLTLDRMNIQRGPRDPSARQIELQELHNARGERLVLLLIALRPQELPQKEDFIAAAQHYLH